MQTVKVTTAQNVDIDYEVASLGDRLLARILDYAVFMGIYMICIWSFLGITAGSGQSNNFDGTGFLIMIIVWLSLCVFYDIVTEVFFNGQSIGKRALKIRVISLNGARPRIGQYMLRWIFRLIDFGVSFGTLAVVSVAFSDNKQRVGDIMAGTTVIKTQPKTLFSDLHFSPAPDDYEPVYKEVMQLSDRDITLVYEVIRIFNRTRNSNLVYRLAVKIRNYLQVTYPLTVNEYQFLEIIVSDYNSLVTKAGA